MRALSRAWVEEPSAFAFLCKTARSAIGAVSARNFLRGDICPNTVKVDRNPSLKEKLVGIIDTGGVSFIIGVYDVYRVRCVDKRLFGVDLSLTAHKSGALRAVRRGACAEQQLCLVALHERKCNIAPFELAQAAIGSYAVNRDPHVCESHTGEVCVPYSVMPAGRKIFVERCLTGVMKLRLSGILSKGISI